MFRNEERPERTETLLTQDHWVRTASLADVRHRLLQWNAQWQALADGAERRRRQRFAEEAFKVYVARCQEERELLAALEAGYGVAPRSYGMPPLPRTDAPAAPRQADPLAR